MGPGAMLPPVLTPVAGLPAAYTPVPIPLDTLALLLALKELNSARVLVVKCCTIGLEYSFSSIADLSIFLLKEITPVSINRAHLAAKWSREQAMSDSLSIVLANIESEEPGIC